MEQITSSPTFSKAALSPELKPSPPKHPRPPRPIPGANRVELRKGKFVAVPVADAASVLATVKTLKLEPLPEIQAKLPSIPKVIESQFSGAQKPPLPPIFVAHKPPLPPGAVKHRKERAILSPPSPQIDVFNQRWHKVDGRMTPIHKGERSAKVD